MTAQADQHDADTEAEAETPEAQLIAHVQEQRDQRRQRIVGEAREKAEAILAEAYSKARLRVDEAADEERARAERELRGVRATVETRLRQERHEVTAQALDAAWDALRDALQARWGRKRERGRWIAAALQLAARRLPAGTWTIEHAKGLRKDELKPLIDKAIKTRESVEAETGAADDIEAGLRIGCGGAVLDATLDGLLAKPARVRARLLAALDTEGALPGHTEASGGTGAGEAEASDEEQG